MGDKNSKEKNSQTNVDVPIQSNDTSQTSTSSDIIQRLPIGQPADIGSLYSAREDVFLDQSSILIPSQIQPLQDSIECKLINISELMEINPELYLSMKLNMVNNDQLSSLINHRSTSNIITKVFFYNYASQVKSPEHKNTLHKSNLKTILKDTSATHIVTQIYLGVLAIVLLEISFDDESFLNHVFKKIKSQMEGKNDFNLSERNNRLLDKIKSIKVFSNLSEISKLTNFVDIYKKLLEIKSNTSDHDIAKYELQPIASFVDSCSEKSQYIPLTLETIKKIEQHLAKLSSMVESLEVSFKSEEMQKKDEHDFKHMYDEIEALFSKQMEEYHSRILKIRHSVQQMRSGVIQDDMITELCIEEYEKSFQDNAKTNSERVDDLNKKLQFIQTLKDNSINYLNVKTIVNENDNNLEKIKELVGENSELRLFCFDDKLEKLFSPLWNKYYQKLLDKHNRSQRKLIYADFSYCSCQLDRLGMLRLNDDYQRRNSELKDQSQTLTTTLPETSLLSIKPTFESQPEVSSSKASTSKERFVNILLFGESGVGKSTFINAIVNYLQFESFPAAHSGDPIVLTPVSFLITEGDNFNERMINFGKEDPNENHNNFGQSVTQYCRSYVFIVGTGTKIRLIDTPGMGDTRGLDQDDHNMQHILSFINHFSHLNAICFLLKPNESNLNVVFCSYFTRLVHFLGDGIRNNIIFCFTNTRSTFYAPGNTGPLLKKMLESHSIQNIPFDKSNTFCFDSESFRYLVARINGVTFDKYQTDEYEHSWITSVDESYRLLNYCCSELKSYPRKKWQSIEHAYFQIIRITRPLLETTRNLLRSIIIIDKSSSKSLIKINAKFVFNNAHVCLTCPKLKFIGEFWVISDDIHILSNECEKCQCDISQHRKVNYKIKYEASMDEQQRPSSEELKKELNGLKTIIAEFIYFFKYMLNISEDKDRILNTLTEIMNEEKEICSRKDSDILNSTLFKKLKNMKITYKNLWTTSPSDQSSMTLSDIYQQISNASKNETIKTQLDAIKQTEEAYIEEQEKSIT